MLATVAKKMKSWYWNTHCPKCKVELESTSCWWGKNNKQYCCKGHLPK